MSILNEFTSGIPAVFRRYTNININPNINPNHNMNSRRRPTRARGEIRKSHEKEISK